MPHASFHKDLFDECLPVYRKFLPKVTPIIEENSIKQSVWDIPSTIRELSYLVHSHYRYYGKFPSVVAGQLLEQYQPPSSSHYVLDNFCGSGTTLVESKLRGIKSFGIDISWLSCLASNVKANTANISSIKRELVNITSLHAKQARLCTPPEDPFVKKWFSTEAICDLQGLRELILATPDSSERDFLLVAFIGIVRRVSKAYDGEVRPHINKNKKRRNVLEAFTKKVRDMCSDHNEYMSLIDTKIESRCILGTNLKLPKQFDDGQCYLVISHPPYLNSFNYTPVFSLEFYWGEPFENYYTSGVKSLHKNELTAHPATDKISDSYFSHLENCYAEAYRIQEPGAFLAIVIGDCTRNGKLVPVLDRTIEIVTSLGYSPHEYNFRTTHYGLGKYAYRHRADYHGDANKKDGILVFRR